MSKAIIDPKDGKKKTKKKKPTTTTEPMDTEEVPEEVKLESIDISYCLWAKTKKIPQKSLTQFFINNIFFQQKTCMKILTHTFNVD